MSEAQEQGAYRRITALKDPRAIARELAEQTRIQSIAESIPRGERVAGYWDNNLRWQAYYLKPGYFLVLFYDKAQTNNPDPYTERGLKDCQAWIFHGLRQHTRLTIEAYSTLRGNRSFSQFAHRLATK